MSTEISAEETKEHLQTVERDYAAEQDGPCCFTPTCPGVPLNTNQTLIQQKEEMFKSDVYARKDELLQVDKEALLARPRPK